MLSKVYSPWGSVSACVRFAGQHYSFSGLTPGQQQIIGTRFSSGGAGKAADRQFVTRMGHLDMPLQDPGQYSVNNFYTPRCQYAQNGLDVDGYGFRANISLSAGAECTLLAGDEDEAVGPFILENYLRVLAAYASLQQGGLFLHSAGIIIAQKAYLFLGRSGAGKTTLSRLALEEGQTILSDDANIILPKSKGGFQAGPVPFAGELGQVQTDFSNPCPVAGIYWLEQSREPSVSQMKTSLQTARMIACSPVVNVDPFRLPAVLTNIHSLLQAVPLQVLKFCRDQPFSVLRQLIEK